jgi:flagellar biosynthesis protein FlhB
MKEISINSSSVITIIRWVARITGAFLIVYFLSFFIGALGEIEYQMHHQNPLTDVDTSLVVKIFFLIIETMLFIILMFGLLITFWNEGTGAMVGLGSAVVLVLLISYITGRLDFANLIFLLPPLLFLYCWWQTKKEKPAIR